MDASPLGKLPSELRDVIYDFALLQVQFPRNHHIVALTATCKQIREECQDVFWALNTTFRFSADRKHTREIRELLKQWLITIGPDARHSIQEIEVLISATDRELYCGSGVSPMGYECFDWPSMEGFGRQLKTECDFRGEVFDVMQIEWSTDVFDLAASRLRLPNENVEIRHRRVWLRSEFGLRAPQFTAMIDRTFLQGVSLRQGDFLKEANTGAVDSTGPRSGAVSVVNFTPEGGSETYRGVNPDAVGCPRTLRSEWTGELIRKTVVRG